LGIACKEEYLGLREMRDKGVKKIYREELNDRYSSPNVVRVIKSKRMRWTEHVTRMGGGEAYIGFWLETLRERTTWKTQG
jgi:hypothetical protein